MEKYQVVDEMVKVAIFAYEVSSYVNVGNIVIVLNVLMLFKWYDNYYEISYLWQLFDNMSNYVIYLENVKYYRVSVSAFRRRWLRHMIGKKVPLNLRNGLGYKWHVTRIFWHPNSLSWVRVHLWMRMSELVELSPSSWNVTRHPNSLSWVRVHLWMRTPELVELSPSSLRAGLHDFLITSVALMCKLSMYPSYIPMCSTGEISSLMEEHLRYKWRFG